MGIRRGNGKNDRMRLKNSESTDIVNRTYRIECANRTFTS